MYCFDKIVILIEGRAVAAAAAVASIRKVPVFASNYRRTGSGNGSSSWIAGALALPAAGSVRFNSITSLNNSLFLY